MAQARHWLDAWLERAPVVREVYWQNSARLKKAYCLALDRVGWLRPSAFVLWIATYRCNYACGFCEAGGGAGVDGELTTAEAERLMESVSRMGARRLLISGGEPLLRRDLPELMMAAERRGVAPGLISNGSLVEARWAELKRSRCYLYMTSIDGAEEYHDRSRKGERAFQRALAGLELFAAAGTESRVVKTVVHPGNLGQLEGLRKVVADAGATHWSLTPVLACGRAAGEPGLQLSKDELRWLTAFTERREGTPEMSVDLAESHSYLHCFSGFRGERPFFCGAGLTRCAVMPNGDVLGCGQAYGLARPEGNVRRTPLEQLWREGFQSFRRSTKPAGCEGCGHWGACQGGCWAETEMRGGCLKDVWQGREAE